MLLTFSIVNTVERAHEDNNQHALSIKLMKVQLQSMFLPTLHRRHDSSNKFHRVPFGERGGGNKKTQELKNYKNKIKTQRRIEPHPQ